MSKNTEFVLGTTLAAVAAAILGTSALADEGGTAVEVDVRQAFAPREGFDDNDNVQLVLFGYLPNACYSIGRTEIERDAAGAPRRVRQLAIKRDTGLCEDEASLPVTMKYQIPFVTEAQVGQLPEGSYNVAYRTGPAATAYRAFQVAKARVPTVDDVPYAPVSGAHIRPVVPIGDDATALIYGTLTSECVGLDPNVGVRVIDDVVVVLPALKARTSDGQCEYIEGVFERDVNLGKLFPGRYLLHVRSQNGKAVNRIFQVGKPD